MKDQDFADEVIARLNRLIEEEPVRKALSDLCLQGKVEVSDDVAAHESIQVLAKDGKFLLGFLGMLNGIVGSIAGGELDRCGYVAAVYDKPLDDSPMEDWKLTSFSRFDE